MLLAAGGMLVLYLVLPINMLATGYIDSRFAAMASLLLVLAFRPDLPSRFARSAATILFVVSLVQTSVVGWVWQDRQADIAALQRALIPCRRAPRSCRLTTGSQSAQTNR